MVIYVICYGRILKILTLAYIFSLCAQEEHSDIETLQEV